MFRQRRNEGKGRGWMTVEEMWEAYPERFTDRGFAVEDAAEEEPVAQPA